MVVFALISPIVWIPDYLRKEIVVRKVTVNPGRTLTIYETFIGREFYLRELKDSSNGTVVSVVLDPDAPKAWLSSIRNGKSSNLYNLHFLTYHGTYNLQTREYTYRDGTVFPAYAEK